MNRKMTCLAFGLKLGMRALATPCTGVASALASDSPIRLAKLSMPKPLPILHNASRRESGWRAGRCNMVVFLLIHKLKFVRTQQHAGIFVPGGRGLAGHLISGSFRVRLQEIQAGLGLRIAGRAPKQNTISLLNARRIAGLIVYAPGKCLGLFIPKTAVHEIQALQRNIGGEALLGGERWIRIIEYLQEIVQPVAADLAEYCAPVVVVGEIGGWPAGLLQVQRSGNEQQRIANGLSVQTLAVGAPVQPVGAVFLRVLRRRFGAELIGGRK